MLPTHPMSECRLNLSWRHSHANFNLFAHELSTLPKIAPNIFCFWYGSVARMKVARRRPKTLLQCLYTVDSSGFVMVCMFVMFGFDFPEDDIFWIFKYFEVLKVAISRMHMIIPWDAPAPSNSGK